MSSQARPLILLDIDETLVHVSQHWLNRVPSFTFRLCGECFHVYVRPGIEEFIRRVASVADIGIWTAAERQYAVCILRRLFGPSWRRELKCFRHRRHCLVNEHGYYIKDLSTISHPNILLVDDNTCHATEQPRIEFGNRVVLVEAYNGCHLDTELRRTWYRLLRRMRRYQLTVFNPRTVTV